MNNKLLEFIEFRIAQENHKLYGTNNDDAGKLLIGSLEAFKEIRRYLKNTKDDK